MVEETEEERKSLLSLFQTTQVESSDETTWAFTAKISIEVNLIGVVPGST